MNSGARHSCGFISRRGVDDIDYRGHPRRRSKASPVLVEPEQNLVIKQMAPMASDCNHFNWLVK